MATARTKPAANQEPKIDLGAAQVTVWKPTIRLSGGTVATCPHQTYGHESEKAAQRCVRSLLAQNGSQPAPARPALDKLVADSQPKPAAHKLRSGTEGSTQAA
jgi:hypothetical protein